MGLIPVMILSSILSAAIISIIKEEPAEVPQVEEVKEDDNVQG